ncbi:uncharacterized protein [Lepisosteus oculatus]|uniref:uncharacterized protein isoform X2 n=1 Tax=Lepisosteus oculatus TaxID=7918 RepID=UPI0037207887
MALSSPARTFSLTQLCLLLVHIQSLSVQLKSQFQNVIPGQDLVLEAQIDTEPSESVYMVSWERRQPGDSLLQIAKLFWGPTETLKTFSERVALTDSGATLWLRNFSAADSGLYGIIVTAEDGTERSAQATVSEYEPISSVSVSMAADSPPALLCAVGRGTAPVFQWLQAGVPVSPGRYLLSADGRSLAPAGLAPLCGLFTCQAHNELGEVTANYTAQGSQCTGRTGKTGKRGFPGLGAGLALALGCGTVLTVVIRRQCRAPAQNLI